MNFFCTPVIWAWDHFIWSITSFCLLGPCFPFWKRIHLLKNKQSHSSIDLASPSHQRVLCGVTLHVFLSLPLSSASLSFLMSVLQSFWNYRGSYGPISVFRFTYFFQATYPLRISKHWIFPLFSLIYLKFSQVANNFFPDHKSKIGSLAKIWKIQKSTDKKKKKTPPVCIHVPQRILFCTLGCVCICIMYVCM